MHVWTPAAVAGRIRFGLRCARDDSIGDCMAGNVALDAVIVGVQKSGTTSLAATLSRHPSLCLARDKETHLFDSHDVQQNGLTPDVLDHHFPGRRPGQLLVDATPSYAYLPGCMESLVRHCPGVRIVLVLRDPAERAVSHHAHETRLGFERRSFLAAIAAERWRLRRDRDPLAPNSAHRHFSYLDRGRYERQVAHLRRLTPHHKIVLFEDLLERTEDVINDIYRFLGVSTWHVGEFPHLNARDTPVTRRHVAVARMLMRSEIRMRPRLVTTPDVGHP